VKGRRAVDVGGQRLLEHVEVVADVDDAGPRRRLADAELGVADGRVADRRIRQHRRIVDAVTVIDTVVVEPPGLSV
jgi:hypothetical protein